MAIPIEIAVIAIIKFIASFLGSKPTSFNTLCTLENPMANNGNAKDNAITDKKLTLPTNLKATPIAKTATAISKITPIPSLKFFCDFLSLPKSSTTLSFLPAPLPIFMIVC